MADTKITALTALTGADPANDVIPIVDVSDTTMAASGTTKKISVNNILGASGTATLASATITGAATVGSDLTLSGSENYVYLSSNYSIGNNSRVRFRAVGAGGGSGYGGDFRISTRASNNTWNTDVLTIDSSANCIWTDGAGGTRMTLNSTGLGVGVIPGGTTGNARISIVGGVLYDGSFDIVGNFTNSSTSAAKGVLLGYNNSTNNGIISAAYGNGTEGLTFWTHNGSSWGQRMELTATGNVGIGVTPSAWAAGYKVIQGQIGGFALSNDNSSNNQFRLSSNAYFDTTDNRWEYYGSSTATAYEQRAGEHRFFNAPSGTLNTAITFTQAMTLTAGGELLVGTTSASVGANNGFRLIDSGGRLELGSVNSANSSIGLSMYSTGAAAYRFYVGWGGTVYATNTTISAISDARLKENVQDIDVGLGAILALKPRKFDWKAGKGKDIKGDRGFIAQEFEQVFPQLVDQWADEAPENEAPYKSVRQDLIPVLVKAIQELAARVQTLETR